MSIRLKVLDFLKEGLQTSEEMLHYYTCNPDDLGILNAERLEAIQEGIDQHKMAIEWVEGAHNPVDGMDGL